jgi:hypothetical protein
VSSGSLQQAAEEALKNPSFLGSSGFGVGDFDGVDGLEAL